VFKASNSAFATLRFSGFPRITEAQSINMYMWNVEDSAYWILKCKRTYTLVNYKWGTFDQLPPQDGCECV
jgi:hypothetical protein